MDGTSSSATTSSAADDPIKAFFLTTEQLDSTLSQAIVNLNTKGDTSALCQVLRYGLSSSRTKVLSGHLKRQGHVLTLTSESKFLETVLRIANAELGMASSTMSRITVDELMTPGNADLKRKLAVDILVTATKRSEELENRSDYSIATPPSPSPSTTSYGSRRRSYSAGAEHLRIGGPTFPVKADGRSLKPARPTTNGPTSTETWVSSPSPPLLHPNNRAGYYPARSSAIAMTPPSPLYPSHASISGVHREDEYALSGRSNGANGCTSLPGNVHSSPRQNASPALLLRSAPVQSVADDDSGPLVNSQVSHTALHISTLQRTASEVSIGSLSPRERMLSPQTKQPGQGQSYVSLASLRSGHRRLDLEEEHPLSPGSSRSSVTVPPTESCDGVKNGKAPCTVAENNVNIAERLSQLELRIENEVASIHARFSRLEQTIDGLARIIIAQAKASGNAPCDKLL